MSNQIPDYVEALISILRKSRDKFNKEIHKELNAKKENTASLPAPVFIGDINGPMEVPKKRRSRKVEETEEEKKLLDHFFRRWGELQKETDSFGAWRDEWAVVARKEILAFQRKENIPFWRLYAVCKWAKNDPFWCRNFYTPAKLAKKNKEGIPYYYVLERNLSVDDWYNVDPKRNPSNYTRMKETGKYVFSD